MCDVGRILLVARAFSYLVLLSSLLPLSPTSQARCEAILRTQPSSRVAKELHLAAIAAHEKKEKKKMKQAAIASAGLAAAIGVAAGIASIAFKK